eukprot:SAG31_NODE_381_length_16458_cov_18.069259_11_plen_106_part_00
MQSVQASHHNTEVVTVTLKTSSGDANAAGSFRGSVECAQCCQESPFEASINGDTAWVRIESIGTPVALGGGLVQIELESALFLHANYLRFAFVSYFFRRCSNALL